MLSWLCLGSSALRLATHFPKTRPIYLSPSSSVFSRFRSITSPTVLANLCGEWGTPAGRRNIYSGGDKVPVRLQSPTETSVPAASWASQFIHRVQPSPPLCPAYHSEPEGMLGSANDGVAQRKKCPRMGPELVGMTGRQEKAGGQDLDQSQDEWHSGFLFWQPFAPLPQAPRAQPHLSLPNDHILVFPLFQDSENHVALQLIKHLWDRTADRVGSSPLPLPAP